MDKWNKRNVIHSWRRPRTLLSSWAPSVFKGRMEGRYSRPSSPLPRRCVSKAVWPCQHGETNVSLKLYKNCCKPGKILPHDPLNSSTYYTCNSSVMLLSLDSISQVRAQSGCPDDWRVLNVLHRVASQVAALDLGYEAGVASIRQVRRARFKLFFVCTLGARI